MHPEVGRVVVGRDGGALGEERLLDTLAGARFVLLGETHDHPEHHRLQARVIEGLVARGRRPAIAFEMLPADVQSGVDASRTPAELREAVGWDASGWPDFALYEPVFASAFDAGLEIRAADLTDVESAAVRAGATPETLEGFGLDEELPAPLYQALARDVRDAHCGYLPEAQVPAVIRVQRARDAALARALVEAAEAAEGAEGADGADAAVLVTGAEHARLDRGVPRTLTRLAPRAEVASLAFLEIDAGAGAARAVLHERYGGEIPFDFVWLTTRHDPRDPCERFRESLEGLARPATEGEN